MSTLAAQQQAVLSALLDAQPDMHRADLLGLHSMCGVRGWQVYRANTHMLAERALGAAYPVLALCVGADSFHDLARALWHAHPPICGDVSQWGEDLAEFLQHSAQTKDAPYLPDVARLEWRLHRASTAADAVVEVESVALLTYRDPGEVRLRLSPGWAVLRSQWPVVSLVLAHQNHTAGSACGPDLAPVARRMASGVGEAGIVWRDGWAAKVRLALPGEADLLEAFRGGASLADALQQAPDCAFDQWFPLAISSGLVCGVEVLE